MLKVIIEKSTTAIRVVCNKHGQFAEAPSVSIFPFLRYYLMEYEWDYRQRKNIHKYSYFKYDQDTGVVHMPVHVLVYLQRYLDDRQIQYRIEDRPYNPSIEVDVVNTSEFEDRDYQIESIEFLTSDQPMKALSLQTGCIVGSSMIRLCLHGERYECRIDEGYRWFHNLSLYDQEQVHTLSYTGNKLVSQSIKYITYSGVKTVYRMTLDNGLVLIATADHKIQTPDGMIPLIDTLDRHVVYDNRRSPFPSCSRVVSIDYVGEEKTYDIWCNDPYHNFVANDIVIHNSGKTYIAVRTIQELKRRSLIVVPASLIDQWADVLYSICDTQIDVIRGNKSIVQLIENQYQTETAIFLASITTLQEYASGRGVYENFPSIQEFIRDLQIGVKIVDEAHLNFYANTMIDIQSDVQHNIYLSATYMRSNKVSDRIFRRIFPQSIMYSGKDYERYVDITEVQYDVGIIPEKVVITDRGYNQFRYEKYLLRKTTKMTDFIRTVLHPLIQNQYIDVMKPGQKLLMIVGLKEFAEVISAWVKETYPHLSSIAFLHGSDDSCLDNIDIIISTLGSCGTGRDIQNLKTMILFQSFGSEALTMQTIGRLRKLPDNETPIFIYLVNRGIISHKRHADIRRPIYKHIGRSFTQTVLR